jgi:hypothetical protein
MLQDESDSAERALRALEERADLSKRMEYGHVALVFLTWPSDMPNLPPLRVTTRRC